MPNTPPQADADPPISERATAHRPSSQRPSEWASRLEGAVAPAAVGALLLAAFAAEPLRAPLLLAAVCVALAAWGAGRARLRKAEQQLLEQKELVPGLARYRAMFQENRAICLLVDPVSGRIEDANQAAAEFYARPREALLGANIAAISSQTEETLKTIFEASRSGGGTFQLVRSTPEGDRRDVQLHVGPFRSGGRDLLLATLQDVSERVRAQKALAESRERFQRAVRAGRVGLVEWDVAGGGLMCDALTEELFGLAPGARVDSPEELIARLHPDDRQRVRERLAEAIAQRRPFEASCRVVDANGAQRHIEATAMPQLDADGRVHRMAGALIDATRLRRTEEELAHSHRLLQTLIDALPHTLFCKDLEGRYLLVNRAFAEMRGGRVEDFIGRTIIGVAPEEAALHDQWDRRALEAGIGAMQSYEYDRDLPGGGVEHRLVYKSVLLFPDGEKRIVGFNVDNTLRKRAEQRVIQNEERFRALFEEGPVPSLVLDGESRVLLANRAWRDALGYGPREVLGRGFEHFLAPESLEAFRKDFRQLVALGRGAGLEHLLLRKNGGGVLFRLDARVFQGDADEPLRIHCALQDITKRRAAELDLAQSHRFLQTLIDTLPVPFVCKDADARYLMVNQAFLDCIGASRDEVLGHRIADFRPSPLARLHAERDGEVLAGAGEGSIQYEIEQALADGACKHWLVFKSRLALPGGPPGVAAISLDITERKIAEEALRRERRRLVDVISGTNAGTWEWNITTGEVLCNERWAEIIGYTMEELGPLTVDDCEGHAHPEDIPRLHKAAQRHFTGETELFDCEFRIRHKQGRWLWVHARGRVFKRGLNGLPLLMSGSQSDIDARKQAEDQLELVARIPVESPHPVLRADARGELLYANPAAQPLLDGWGRKVGGALPDELRREVALALASGQARTSERAYPSGVYAITVSPFVDRGYANIYAVDETQRKQAETAQRLSELKYRELAVMLRLMCDNVPDMIWAKDVDNRYLFANKAMCESFLGVQGTEAPIGRTEEDFARREQARHPENPNWHTIWEACVRSDAETLAGVGRGRYEESGYFQGEFKHFDVCKAPFVNDQGVVIGTVGSARDVTDRKAAEEALAKSEERFRTMTQVSPVGIFQADANARCTYVNEHWARITGFPKQAPLGLGWVRTIPSEARRGAIRALRETALTGKEYVTEFRFRQPGGHDAWVLLHATAERGPDGKPAGIVGALTDITGLKRAEAALRKAKAEAEAATQAKALFLANMSHEIRTPLTGVIGSTRQLARSPLSESQRKLAEMAVESGGALLEVVNDILDFSKIEAGQMPLRPQPFSLRRLLDSVTAPYALLARERGLSLSVQVRPNAPDDHIADEGRLAQVLRNLLANALKFTESGGVTLTARFESTAADCPRLLFTVTDTGIGIEPGYLPHIFDSFSQADQSYAKRHGGTGLGLAICKSLVERMGGSIQVLSTPGRGSTFSFAVQVETPAATEPAGPIPPAAEASPEGGLRLLLADDNAIGRMIMEQVLKTAGHRVTCAADGREVLAQLAKQTFDLVLMDVQMPKLDGVAATRLIRAGQAGHDRADVAIVALTAYASPADRRNFLEAGMDESVAKPAEESALREAMQNALAKAKTRRHAKGQTSAPGETTHHDATTPKEPLQ